MSNQDGFCSGLKPSKINILLRTYRLERKSKQELDDYLIDLKMDNLNEYNDFLSYKEFVENRTPNLKEIYYDFLDGKINKINFELFSPF